MESLPSFDELMNSPNGQSVEIRGADNSVLVSLGPSYGEWLPFARIPHTMTEAMIAVEDRRFYQHPGVDPIGIARVLAVAGRRRPLHARARRRSPSSWRATSS